MLRKIHVHTGLEPVAARLHIHIPNVHRYKATLRQNLVCLFATKLQLR